MKKEILKYYSGHPVLVTGAMGFIGSHLTEALVRNGARVRVLGRYSSSSSIGSLSSLPQDILQEVEVRLGDVTDHGFVRSAVQGCETVFHLAALIGIPYSYVAPSQYVSTNVLGTMNVLDAVRSEGCVRMVQTSTSETFGSAQFVPMNEEHPLRAQSPYAATKVAADQLCFSYFASFGTPVVILRPFNTFGPRQSLRAVIPAAISQLLRGPEIQLGNVESIRDMNPVSNTVLGFLLAGMCPDVGGETFVIGSGEGRTVREIVELAAELIGVEPLISLDSDRLRPTASEVDRLLCDYSKASRVLGYEPQTTFREGIGQTIDWLRTRPESDTKYAV